MEAELPGIHRGKEIAAQKRDQTHRDQEERRHRNEDHAAMIHGPFESAVISIAQPLKSLVEAIVDAMEKSENTGEPAAFLLALLRRVGRRFFLVFVVRDFEARRFTGMLGEQER